MDELSQSHCFFSLVVQQQIRLYLFPDGSRVNRPRLGWVLSFNILLALHKHLNLAISLIAISLMLDQGVPMMLQLVLINYYRPVHITCQYIMFPIRILSIAPL